MKGKSSIFMSLGSVVGLAIAILIFVAQYLDNNVSSWTALWFIVFTFIGRIIGYGLDRIVDRNSQKR